MAKRVNWLALIKENMAAKALMEGMRPLRYHSKKTRAKSSIVAKLKKIPNK
jgi:hypothetical protein